MSYSIIAYSPDTKERFSVQQYGRQEGIRTFLSPDLTYLTRGSYINDEIQNLFNAIEDQKVCNGFVSIELDRKTHEFFGDKDYKSLSGNSNYQQLFKKKYPRGFKYYIIPYSSNGANVKWTPAAEDLYEHLSKYYTFYNNKVSGNISMAAYFPDTKETLPVDVSYRRSLVFYENRNDPELGKVVVYYNTYRKYLENPFQHAIELKVDGKNWDFKVDKTKSNSDKQIDLRKALEDIKSRSFKIVLVPNLIKIPMFYSDPNKNKIGSPDSKILEVSTILENLYKEIR